MTDGELIKICRCIDNLSACIWSHIRTIKQSDHPNKDAIEDAFMENGIGICANADRVALDHLANPDDWEINGGEVVHKAATKAVKTRMKQ